jgi:hypothetical protein
MLYSDEFLENFSQNPIASTKTACWMALAVVLDSTHWTVEEMEAMEEADTLMIELQAAKLLPVPYTLSNAIFNVEPRAQKASKVRTALDDVIAACEALELSSQREALSKRIRMGLGAQFAYEFAHADIERIQTLINELRQYITDNLELDQDHQRRILARLEALQRELHKRVSDLDRFWGLVGEAGVVMAKLGHNAKPIVDRVREIAAIVWNTQGRAEQLPSSAHPPHIDYSSSETQDGSEA